MDTSIINFSRVFVSAAFAASLLATFVSCHGDHSEGPKPGGAECKDNSVCYSHLCYIGGYCAPDGPAEGTVSGGGDCSTNSDCFSNYCVERVCASDSSVQGKISGGGLCVQPDQCFSGTCIRRRCGPDSPVLSKMAAGGECVNNQQCYSGICAYQRCAPDGPEENKAPGGGYCMYDGQCVSGVCLNSQCAPDSYPELNKVADGGRCHTNENCQSTSNCHQQLCTPKDSRSGAQTSGQTSTFGQSSNQKYAAGAFCQGMQDCQAACNFQRCATPSRFNTLAIADGGYCAPQQSSVQGQCKSGQCINGVCAASVSDRMWSSATAAGAPCSVHQACYSGFCASGKCSADSPGLLVNVFSNVHRNRGQVAGGGFCYDDEDCYSGYCELHSMCGADGPKRGTLASGALCTNDRQCFSNYCFQRRCVAGSSGSVGSLYQQIPVGKAAPGGHCAYTDACHPATICMDTYCKALEPHGQAILGNLTSTRPTLASVPWNGTCWHNAQCIVGRCLDHRCTVAWYLTEKYVSSAESRFSNWRLTLFLSATTIWLISSFVEIN